MLTLILTLTLFPNPDLKPNLIPNPNLNFSEIALRGKMRLH